MLKQITATIIIAVLMPLNLLAQFNISGKVIDKENHDILIGAHVSLNELNLITVTDENGDFRFENIKKGTYTLEATYLGFKTYSADVKVTKDTKINIR